MRQAGAVIVLALLCAAVPSRADGGRFLSGAMLDTITSRWRAAAFDAAAIRLSEEVAAVAVPENATAESVGTVGAAVGDPGLLRQAAWLAARVESVSILGDREAVITLSVGLPELQAALLRLRTLQDQPEVFDELGKVRLYAACVVSCPSLAGFEMRAEGWRHAGDDARVISVAAARQNACRTLLAAVERSEPSEDAVEWGDPCDGGERVIGVPIDIRSPSFIHGGVCTVDAAIATPSGRVSATGVALIPPQLTIVSTPDSTADVVPPDWANAVISATGRGGLPGGASAASRSEELLEATRAAARANAILHLSRRIGDLPLPDARPLRSLMSPDVRTDPVWSATLRTVRVRQLPIENNQCEAVAELDLAPVWSCVKEMLAEDPRY